MSNLCLSKSAVLIYGNLANVLIYFTFINKSSLFFNNSTVDHTRVKLVDVDTTQIGAEYINANYIRQPSETDQCDMNSSSTENLSASLCAACTFAQQQKNCQNCQLLNKTCVQCAMKSAIIPLNGNCTNCGKKTEVGVVRISFNHCFSIKRQRSS